MIKLTKRTTAFVTFAILILCACSLNDVDNKPPVTPYAPAPPNGATNVSRNADLGWRCEDPDGEPLTYDVYWGTSSNPILEAGGMTETYYLLPIMEPNTKFYWRIVAKDPNGGETASPIWNFTTGTGTNVPPTPPANPNPADGASGVDVNADLSWTCLDPENDPLVYDIYFGNSSNPPLVKSNHGSPNYDPGTMNANGVYYWKIVAKDNQGGQTPGPLWHFTTGGWPAPTYQGQWGSYGSGNGQFNIAAGVAVAPNGNVYVADYNNNRVQYFTSTGGYLGKWGTYGTGAGLFKSTAGVAVASNGDVYVTDQYNNQVQRFNSSGTYITGWTVPTSPRGVAIGPNGYIYVSFPDMHEICYYTSGGGFVGSWGTYGSGNGQFNKPWGVAVASNGDVYVADSENNRVQYFTPAGSFLGKWGSYGTGGGQFNKPRGIGVGPDGDVYVAEYGNHRCQRFSVNGGYKCMWGSCGSGNGQFDYPEGIAVAAGGNIYVADTWNHRIQYFH